MKNVKSIKNKAFLMKSGITITIPNEIILCCMLFIKKRLQISKNIIFIYILKPSKHLTINIKYIYINFHTRLFQNLVLCVYVN